MIKATPHNGDPVIYVHTEIGGIVEDIMTRLGYGCDEYNLALVTFYRITSDGVTENG